MNAKRDDLGRFAPKQRERPPRVAPSRVGTYVERRERHEAEHPFIPRAVLLARKTRER